MTDRVLEFTVEGVAATKGSGRALISKSTGRAIFKPDNPRTKSWQKTVATAAMIAQRLQGHAQMFTAGPVLVAMVFYLPRPQALLSRKTAAIAIPHVKKPDVDKAARAICDALTKTVWTDDSQVTDLIARKRYCVAGEAPRVVIRVRPADAGGLYGRS